MKYIYLSTVLQYIHPILYLNFFLLEFSFAPPHLKKNVVLFLMKYS